MVNVIVELFKDQFKKQYSKQLPYKDHDYILKNQLQKYFTNNNNNKNVSHVRGICSLG